jgi:hypothetical protein
VNAVVEKALYSHAHLPGARVCGEFKSVDGEVCAMLKKVLLQVRAFGLWRVGFLGVLGAVLVVFVVIMLTIRIVIKSIPGTLWGDRLTHLCRMAQDVLSIRMYHGKARGFGGFIGTQDWKTNIRTVWCSGTGRGLILYGHPTHVKESSKLGS